jgi:hypothetical protein
MKRTVVKLRGYNLTPFAKGVFSRVFIPSRLPVSGDFRDIRLRRRLQKPLEAGQKNPPRDMNAPFFGAALLKNFAVLILGGKKRY